jgi:hypothetical protein
LRDKIGVMRSWGPVTATYEPGEKVTSKGGGFWTSSPEAVKVYLFDRLIGALSSFGGDSFAVGHFYNGSRTITCSVREHGSVPVSLTFHDDPAYPSTVNLWLKDDYTQGDWPVLYVLDVAQYKIVVTYAAQTREYLRAKHGSKPTIYEELCGIVGQRAKDAAN